MADILRPMSIEPHSNVVATALAWLQGTLLGTIATTIAVIAIAWLGFLMLSGRIDIRRAVQVIFGCFIIFGASAIADGILRAQSGGGAEPALAPVPAPPYPLPAPTVSSAADAPYDPYAGAALPHR